MPSLLTDGAHEKHIMQATGTDPGLRPVCALPDIRGDKRGPAETEGSGDADGKVGRKPLPLQAVAPTQDQPITNETTTPGRIRTCDPRFHPTSAFAAALERSWAGLYLHPAVLV